VAQVALAGDQFRTAVAIYVGVAAIWFVPDRRMERALGR